MWGSWSSVDRTTTMQTGKWRTPRTISFRSKWTVQRFCVRLRCRFRFIAIVVNIHQRPKCRFVMCMERGRGRRRDVVVMGASVCVRLFVFFWKWIFVTWWQPEWHTTLKFYWRCVAIFYTNWTFFEWFDGTRKRSVSYHSRKRVQLHLNIFYLIGSSIKR